jgi:hypothetical protein
MPAAHLPPDKARQLRYEARNTSPHSRKIPMTTLVFGHTSPDTDSTGSPLIWAWYLSEVRNEPAEAVLLGEPNTEAAFLL